MASYSLVGQNDSALPAIKATNTSGVTSLFEIGAKGGSRKRKARKSKRSHKKRRTIKKRKTRFQKN
jgi:hypothetical protein